MARANTVQSGMRCCFARLGLLAALPLLAAAGGDTERSFWRDVAHPARQQFERLIKAGQDALGAASKLSRDSTQRAAMLQRAALAFKQATVVEPSHPDGHYWLGRTYYEQEKLDASIACFLRLRRLGQTSAAEDVAADQRTDAGREYEIAFSLGIAYSKKGQFDRAVGEYDRAERWLAQRQQSGDVARRATLQGNAAESLMALGRLDEAVARYREAIRLQPGYVLAWWGLAVALDRDEQLGRALAAVARATRYDTTMRELTGSGVFFIPAGDIHYYYGLGHLAKGQVEQAKAAFSRFVELLPRSPWVRRARAHLSVLDNEHARKRIAASPSLATPTDRAAERTRVRYGLRRYVSQMRTCYRRILQRHPSANGRLKVKVVVDKSGRVTAVRVLATTMPEVNECVVRPLRAASFGRLSERISMIVPFDFRPR